MDAHPSGLVTLGQRRFQPKPEWLKVRLPSGDGYERVRRLLRRLDLHTVCEESRCPNIAECWGGGTATVMLMGDVCTRGCRFCHVSSGSPEPLDEDEPRHLAEAVAELGLRYLVVTSVDRDDLPDQGAGHFAEAIRQMKSRCPETLLEVLIPDFQGRDDLLQKVIEARPDVVAHNVETVRRLTPTTRDARAGYDQSLRLLASLKAQGKAPGSSVFGKRLYSKSSIMLGLGETREELHQTFADLRGAGVDVLTLGQYLQPSSWHLRVERFVSPQEFEDLRGEAMQYGFLYVAAGPLVRSSYRAAEFFMEATLRQPLPTETTR
jgi:lipoic acid synthetase